MKKPSRNLLFIVIYYGVYSIRTEVYHHHHHHHHKRRICSAEEESNVIFNASDFFTIAVDRQAVCINLKHLRLTL